MIEAREGCTVITGKQDINLFRLVSLRGALHLETLGMKMGRGMSAARVVKNLLQVTTTNKLKLLKELEDHIERIAGPLHSRYTH